MEPITCDICTSPATIHETAVEGWTVIARNRCRYHAQRPHPVDRFLGLGIAGFFCLASTVFAIVRPEPPVLAAAGFTTALLALVSWWTFPGAKAFSWAQKRAAVRLLRGADWAEVNRSAVAIIIPWGTRVMPELRKRFRKEFQHSEKAFQGVVSLLDRTDPNWAASEVDYLRTQFLEEVKKPGDLYLRPLMLLDRTDPNWTAGLGAPLRKQFVEALGKPGALFLRYLVLLDRAERNWVARDMYLQNDSLVAILISTLDPHATDRKVIDTFKRSDFSASYMDGWVEDVEETPDLNGSESRVCEELEGRLRLLEQGLRIGSASVPESTLRRLASFPDLGVRGVLGYYTSVSGPDDRDERYRCGESQTGVKKIISCAAVRALAQQRLEVAPLQSPTS